MRLLLPVIIISTLALSSCKQKKKKSPEESFFPVLSFLKSQAAHIDTSLYSIVKLVYTDSVTVDTIYVSREQFKDVASDFLSLPDISTSSYDDRYKEDKQFDETLNRVLITYTPVKPEKEEIQKEEILIKPDMANGDKIKNIIINWGITNKDSSVQKNMLWKADESFQVITTKQLKGQPETTTTVKVIWNEDASN